MVKKTVGITIGKFMPLHKGHELMIEMAAHELDQLVVIVSADDHFVMSSPDHFRTIAKKYANHDNITFLHHGDRYGPARAYDENGTALDEDFWDYWVSVFKKYAPNADYVVSSDMYGQEMAKRLGIEWFPVDPNRELFDISGTQIRENPLENWKYISKEMRPLWAKKVVVVGPESSGKTTLVSDLARTFNSPAVYEYGRVLSEAQLNNLSQDDFFKIAYRHNFMIKKATEETETGLVFVDTEMITTWLYAQYYINKDIKELGPDMAMYTQFFDLWVYVPPLLEWVDDGSRVMSSYTERMEFYGKILQNTKFINQPLFNSEQVVITETNRKRRVDQVSIAIDHMLGTQKDHSIESLLDTA